jgi:hypothetical protein
MKNRDKYKLRAVIDSMMVISSFHDHCQHNYFPRPAISLVPVWYLLYNARFRNSTLTDIPNIEKSFYLFTHFIPAHIMCN